MIALSVESIQSQISELNAKSFSLEQKSIQKTDTSFASMLEQIKSGSSEKKNSSSSKNVDAAPEKNSDVKSKTENSKLNNEPKEKQVSDADEVNAAEAEAVQAAYIPLEKNIYTADFDISNEVSSLNENNISASINQELNLEVTEEQVQYLANMVTPEELNEINFASLVQESSITDNDVSSIEALQNLAAENPEEFLKLSDIANDKEVTPELLASMDLTPEEEQTLKLFTEENFTELPVNETNKTFNVIDERSAKVEIDFKSTDDVKVENVTQDENGINVTYNLSDLSQQNILASNDQSAAANGSTFQEMLTQQVQTNIPDFVKAGTIVLKDNNQGVINLNVRPESLGNVKITLEVTDKVIAGKIVVASKEAFEAFNKNLDQFKQQFQQNGFENAELTLSYADNSSGNFYQQGEQQNSGNDFKFTQTYSEYSSKESSLISSESSDNNYTDSANYTIDVVA